MQYKTKSIFKILQNIHPVCLNFRPDTMSIGDHWDFFFFYILNMQMRVESSFLFLLLEEICKWCTILNCSNLAQLHTDIIGLFLQWLLADFKSLTAKRLNREPEVCDFSKLSNSEVGSSSTHSAINLKWDASWYHLMLGRSRPPIELGSCSFATLSLGLLLLQMKSFSQPLSSFSTLPKKSRGITCRGYDNIGKLFILMIKTLPSSDKGIGAYLSSSFLIESRRGLTLALNISWNKGVMWMPR